MTYLSVTVVDLDLKFIAKFDWFSNHSGDKESFYVCLDIEA